MRRANRKSTPGLSPEEVSTFAQACARIANQVADERGFVPIRRLLERFQARLVVRPLLVEGMLAVLPGGRSWAVLADSDTYAVTAADIADESDSCPLPSRFRFTVAHELTHSLAFRAHEFGIRLRNPIDTDDSRAAVVQAIERVTDRLTPLLLLSDKALASFIKTEGPCIGIENLANFRRRVGISREAFISRLGIQVSTEQMGREGIPPLTNTAVCVGEWADGGAALLRSWPVFVSFDRNIVPAFLLKLRQEDLLPFRLAIDSASFVPCGGARPEIEITVPAGTAMFNDAEQMNIRCYVESTGRTPGAKFLFLVRKSS